MRFVLLFTLLFCLADGISAQTRQQAIEELEKLKERGKSLDAAILQIDKKDNEEASRANVDVFRILPREKYDVGLLDNRGGGAYYSFSNKSSNYNTPEINLERENLSVGFSGANYGFIADLGEIPLAEINEESESASFLMNYQPPNQLAKARIEQERARGLESDGIVYKDRVPFVVGNSYVLRAITFEKADVLVAFNVCRKDTDGSLVIFWKLLKQFEKPVFIRPEQLSLTNNTNRVSASVSKTLVPEIDASLRKNGFNDIAVDISTGIMTLRGTVPKGKLAEVIRLVIGNNGGKPVRNELTEK